MPRVLEIAIQSAESRRGVSVVTFPRRSRRSALRTTKSMRWPKFSIRRRKSLFLAVPAVPERMLN
jgi:hypothetical protein